MSIIKKTYGLLIKTINNNNRCKNCHRTEQDLMGETTNTNKGISIFSPELLCIDCEIEQFPERFHGCGFCKRPIREKFSCIICTNGFVDWVKDVIQPLDTLSVMIRMAAKQLLDKTIYDLTESHRFILRTDDGYYKWPGFYAGITDRFTGFDSERGNCFPIWVIPRLTKPYDVRFTDLKLDLRIFQHMLLDILAKNNISLYHDIQMDPDKIESSQIKTINSYDTRVVRRFD